METNKEISKKELCKEIHKLYEHFCIKDRERSYASYFNPASVEIHKVSQDLQNFSCLQSINSMLKHCIKN